MTNQHKYFGKNGWSIFLMKPTLQPRQLKFLMACCRNIFDVTDIGQHSFGKYFIKKKPQINQMSFLQYFWMLDNFILKEFILKVQNLKRKA